MFSSRSVVRNTDARTGNTPSSFRKAFPGLKRPTGSGWSTYLVDGLPVASADVALHVVDLVRLGVDLVPPLKAVVVEVLRHLLLVLVQRAARRQRPNRTEIVFAGRANRALASNVQYFACQSVPGAGSSQAVRSDGTLWIHPENERCVVE